MQGSLAARVVIACCRRVAPLKLLDDYDFESLEKAIVEADEFVREADELAGELEGRESAIRSVRRVVLALARTVVQSNRLRTLVLDVTERILALDEIAIQIRWTARRKTDFYKAVKWQDEAAIESLLDRYCDE